MFPSSAKLPLARSSSNPLNAFPAFFMASIGFCHPTTNLLTSSFAFRSSGVRLASSSSSSSSINDASCFIFISAIFFFRAIATCSGVIFGFRYLLSASS